MCGYDTAKSQTQVFYYRICKKAHRYLFYKMSWYQACIRQSQTSVNVKNSKHFSKKYLPVGRNPLACLPACLLTLCQLRNFLCKFTEKYFAIFDQSSLTIYLMWYWLLLFFQGFPSIMHSFYDFKILVKSRGGGIYIFMSSIVNVQQK